MLKFSFWRRPPADASGPVLGGPTKSLPVEIREIDEAVNAGSTKNFAVAGLKIDKAQSIGAAGFPSVEVPRISARAPVSVEESFNLLRAYLAPLENFSHEIRKLKRILKMPRLILEIGCGDGEAAWGIAVKNPDVGVIATDKYEWTSVLGDCSHYRKIAMEWRNKRLKAQRLAPGNLTLLRAEADILGFFPDDFFDSIFLLNPEPKVAEAFLKLVREASWISKVKPGPAQIIILPYSRAMGPLACGGFEFDHSEDWSRGIGFLTSGPFNFRQGESVHWGLNLSRLSAYSKNSAQNNLYVYGNQVRQEPESFWRAWIKKIF